MQLLSSFITCPINPLLYSTFGLILGIIAYYSALNIFLVSMLLISLGITTTIAYIYRNAFTWIIILGSCMGIMGYWRYAAIINRHTAITSSLTQPLSVIGTVIAIEPLEHRTIQECVSILIKSAQDKNNNFLAALEGNIIQLYLRRKTKNLQVDDVISCNTLFKTTANKDYNFYLLKEGIAGTLFLPHLEYNLIDHPPTSITRTLFEFKQAVLLNCKEKLSDQNFALFASIFLGNKKTEKEDLEPTKDCCKTWGISHYLARSGLHMVIFALAWYFLFNLLPFPFMLKQAMLLFLSIIYYVLSWSSISFIRAFYTFLLYKMCILIKRPIQVLYILTLVCFFVLLENPCQLFFLDFQLSFGLTYALAWFSHVQHQKRILLHQNIDS